MAIVLVTGPSRSGKSAYAEHLTARFAHQSARSVVYIATAQANPEDAEWQARIEQHRLQRPQDWRVLEVPTELPNALAANDDTHVYLVDSLGTWVANWIEADDERWQTQVEHLLNALGRCSTDVVLVAEEAGWGGGACV